jgi:large subunit ribosomal protein L21
MYAVIETGGKQYRISEGDTIEVEKLPAEVGAEVRFEHVLLVGDEKDTRVGFPDVKGAVVTAKVVAAGKGDKVLVYKIKRRKNYRRKVGHRQEITTLKIQGINAG